MKYPRFILILLAIAWGIIGAGCTTVQPTASHWEYKIARPGVNPGHAERQINELAEEGWIVDSFERRDTGFLILMKRPK